LKPGINLLEYIIGNQANKKTLAFPPDKRKALSAESGGLHEKNEHVFTGCPI
jgi:hypothetical protein